MAPLPSVVRSTVSSCMRTSAPSLLRRTSISTASTPIAAQASIAAIETSGAGPQQPRWARIMTPMLSSFCDVVVVVFMMVSFVEKDGARDRRRRPGINGRSASCP